MSCAAAAIEQASAPGEQGPGADGDQAMPRTNRGVQPGDNGGIVGIIITDVALLSSYLCAGINAPTQHDHRVIGQHVGQ